MKSSHEGDRAVHEAPNANPTEIQSTSFVAAVLSDIADMDNAAFRQMLAKATDGAKRGGGGGGKDELRSIIETEDKRAKQLEKKKEKNREKNEAQAAARGGKPGAADAGGYRDRANERRKEANPDYDDALTQMVALDVEKSKYLGGDVEHTHLVRGLDSKARPEGAGSPWAPGRPGSVPGRGPS